MRYWREDFDWRQQEAKINKFDQFTTTISGINLHFIHQRSSDPNAIPLLLSHGWPGSIWEFHKIIPKLTATNSHGVSFHVVAPSLPGFGFSSAPKRTDFSVRDVADIFDTLMVSLGYNRYLAQGGDYGSAISSDSGR